MPVLSHDTDRPERCRRAKDGPDIVRIGHLVEDQQDGVLRRLGQDVVEPGIFQRLDFDDDALVRRIAGD